MLSWALHHNIKEACEDFFEIEEEEMKELFDIVNKLKWAVKNSFGADLFNYASFGNVIRHVHLHFIPRYKKPVVFHGVKFVDKRWGRNYAPYNRSFKIPEKVVISIRDVIKNVLISPDLCK